MIMKPESGEIVTRDIFDLLPHRYPFLLVDRVLSFEPMKSIHAIKSLYESDIHVGGDTRLDVILRNKISRIYEV